MRRKIVKSYLYYFLLIVVIVSCKNNHGGCLYPNNIGLNKISSVVDGDSAFNEINLLHFQSVATNNNIIVRYGQESEDILYISNFKDISSATISLETMLSKMRANKNLPFSDLVPMKIYNNKSYMTLGLGSVHYIYQSGEYILWLSTKQKFYNELPKELLEIYPVNQ
jgi:hypothetical protein